MLPPRTDSSLGLQVGAGGHDHVVLVGASLDHPAVPALDVGGPERPDEHAVAQHEPLAAAEPLQRVVEGLVGRDDRVCASGRTPSRTGRSGSRPPTLRALSIETVPTTRPASTTGNACPSAPRR